MKNNKEVYVKMVEGMREERGKEGELDRKREEEIQSESVLISLSSLRS